MVRGDIRKPLHTIGAALAVWLIVGRIHLLRFAWKVKGRRNGAMVTPGIAEQIRNELLIWPGVTAARHRYGGVEYRLGKRELGHLHGDYLADLPFPVRVRYAETDKMGVVYYANYLIWFEIGRTEWLRDTGWTYREMEADGCPCR